MRKQTAKKLLAFLFVVSGIFFAHFLLAANFGIEAVNNGLDGSLATGDPRTIAARIINVALGFLGVVAIGIIIYAGFIWMSSSGEEEKISQAKKILKSGVIGLVIILSSWAIATFILTQLSGAINGSGGGCTDGDSYPCGCGGQMVCSNGEWGACVGSDPANCLGGAPTSCSNPSNPNSCVPLDSICLPSDYCDNSCLCQPKGDLGDSCDTDPTNQTCDPSNNRCSEYLTCDTNTCLCAGPPVITGISPVGGFCNTDINKPCATDSDCLNNDTCNQSTPNGKQNNLITIFGKNFGEYVAGVSQVRLMGSNNPQVAYSPSQINANCINSWHDDQIVIGIPSAAQVGPIEVTNKDALTDVTNNNIGPVLADFVPNDLARPGLCLIDPKNGTLSAEVGYQGINLTDGKAYFGNYENNVGGLSSIFVEKSGTTTIPNIQTGESGSFVEKEINGFQQKSNYLKFTKDREAAEGPYIVSFSPTSGPSGQYVTIKGAGFGGARGDNHVYFGTGPSRKEAKYNFPAICANSVWKDKQIIVKVPEGLVDGSYQLELVIGSTTVTTENLNPNVFTYGVNLPLAPSLCKMDPERGPIQTPVALWGEYFGVVGQLANVKFYDNQINQGTIIKENDADTATTTVPDEAVTGPVVVVKGSDVGNELNFIVGECTKNDECDSQVCCPQNTYQKGRCVADINECFIDIPTSVFEWSFSTSFGATTTPTFDSCLGLSQYLGACSTADMCPNSPGACSAPASSYKKIVGTCDITCANTPGCTPATCSYDLSIDKCKGNSPCDLATSTTFVISGRSYTVQKTCNKDGLWEINFAGSCPSGWSRAQGNRCVKNNSSCSLCADNLSCEAINSVGTCVSNKLCSTQGAACIDNPVVSEPDNCTVDVAPSCECCCRISNADEDCCAGLDCTGNCGSDLITDTDTYGRCSGCGLVGNTTAEHDAACNCAGHGSQFCDISEDPNGVCTDCAKVDDQTTCGDHSSVCCFDSNRTIDTADDKCRGVAGREVVSTTPLDPNYGYCGYYNCNEATVPPVCDSNTPLKIGFFDNVDACVNGCESGNDICHIFNNNLAACMGASSCCYDKSTDNCISGTQIASATNPINNGYCAYYECKIDNPGVCEDQIPVTEPGYNSTSTCAYSCANPLGGAGLDCSNHSATSSCNFGLCTYPGFQCLAEGGSVGAYPDCGTCCCEPGLPAQDDSCNTLETPNLRCIADKGLCSGAGRGLCCGCTKDSDCGADATIGCGADSCCEARPTIIETMPTATSTDVCRNASIKVTFNQNMDPTSFGSNFLLFEERAYGNGVCPAGTFLTDARLVEDLIHPPSRNIFVRLWRSLNLAVHRLFIRANDQALAALPTTDKLYCATLGTVSAEEAGSHTSLIFAPGKLLAPATNYYVVVVGDKDLNSQTGVLSAVKVGMNERGFNDGTNFTPGANVKFNDRAYANSYSFSFRTMSDQGANAGVCAVDHVSINPRSYLFKTTDNDLNENDADALASTFDTKADRDKVFSAGAYSDNNQLLNSVPGYAWNWNWTINDTAIVQTAAATNLSENRALARAQSGITDGQTKINAKVNMDAYKPAALCGTPSHPSCNAYFAGDGESKASDMYVFICNNPWPAVDSFGNWSPWQDSTEYGSYQYKFYYCRDAGAPGTLDDLPVIKDSPLNVNTGSNLLCSSDKKPCLNPLVAGSPCGKDQNGDGSPDGLCIWNVLKESYFFRESTLSEASIYSAEDIGPSGQVEIKWTSPVNSGGSYKIYYSKASGGAMLIKEVKAANACSGLDCKAIIDKLINNQAYLFKLTVVSDKKTESAFSNEKTATPTDKTIPAKPEWLQSPNNVTLSTTTIKFSWDPNPDSVSFYRLYHGIASGKYGESFDSASGATSLTFNRSQFTPSINYFALTAVNSSNHESPTSTELHVDLGPNWNQ